jgi:hypothetical protein
MGPPGAAGHVPAAARITLGPERSPNAFSARELASDDHRCFSLAVEEPNHERAVVGDPEPHGAARREHRQVAGLVEDGESNIADLAAVDDESDRSVL